MHAHGSVLKAERCSGIFHACTQMVQTRSEVKHEGPNAGIFSKQKACLFLLVACKYVAEARSRRDNLQE